MDICNLSDDARVVLMMMSEGHSVRHNQYGFTPGATVNRAGFITVDGRSIPVQESAVMELESAGFPLMTYEHNSLGGWKTIIPMPNRNDIAKLFTGDDIPMVAGSEFNAYQQSALVTYNDGDHCVETKDDIKDCGDGLLQFLMVELSTNEDCGTVSDAIKRISRSIEQLAAVKAGLESMEIADDTKRRPKP